MSQRRRLVEEDVEHDQQLELLERASEASRVRHGDERIAAGDEQRLHLTVAGSEDLVGENAAGERVVDGRIVADPRAVGAHQYAVLHAEAREVDDAVADEGAAAPIEIAGDGVDHLLEPERERAVAAHVHARRAVERGTAGAAVGMDHLAELGRGDASDLFGPLRRPGCGQSLDLLEARHVAFDALAIDAAGDEQLVQEAEIEKHVGARPDDNVLAGDLGRLREARVDEEDTAAAGLDALQALGRIGNLEKAPLGDDGVGADHDQTLGVLEVGERLRERKAVDAARDGELVGAVLSRRAVHALRAEPGHEALREHRMQRAEAGGRADIHRDRIGTVGAADARDLFADRRDAVLPRGPLEAVADPLQRVEKPIG